MLKWVLLFNLHFFQYGYSRLIFHGCMKSCQAVITMGSKLKTAHFDNIHYPQWWSNFRSKIKLPPFSIKCFYFSRYRGKLIKCSAFTHLVQGGPHVFMQALVNEHSCMNRPQYEKQLFQYYVCWMENVGPSCNIIILSIK